MSTFDSTKTELGKLLDEVVEGRLQLPDFQRGWVWDDEHIRSLLVSIARSFPIGAVMLLVLGGLETTAGVLGMAMLRFCEHPELPAVGGTKDPDLAAIVALAPDLVVVNDEENRRPDADALTAAGLRLHVTHVEAVDEMRKQREN